MTTAFGIVKWPENKARFTYNRPLVSGEAAVLLWLFDERDDAEELVFSAYEDCSRYGINLDVHRGKSPPTPTTDATVSLLLLVRCAPFRDAPDLDAIIGNLQPHYSIVSIAHEYADSREMLGVAGDIERAKERYRDRVNFLRPIADASGRMVVPADKIVDNMICDTVRVKYRPRQMQTTIPTMSGTVEQFFIESAQSYMSRRLYHRSASDGYFAIKHPDRDGFYITATKTYKDAALLERITFVEGYEEAANTLTYSGPYLPSSDSVEAAVVLQSAKYIKSLIHTHASARFTRNPNYRSRVLVGRERYGEPLLGRLITEALEHVGDGFIIMEDHGEVFAGEDASLPRLVDKMVSES